MSQTIWPDESKVHLDIGEWMDKNYLKWLTYLGMKDDRPIKGSNNTRVFHHCDKYDYFGKQAYIAIRLHGTDILSFSHDKITYRCNGWFTHTTKHRFNLYGPLHVWQEKKRWWYADPNHGMRMRFVDGMTFNKHGMRTDNLDTPDWEEEDI